MSSAAHTPSTLRRRVPNALTLGRLALAAGFVALLTLYAYPDVNAWALPAALGLFVVAALTDALDGHLARKWNAVSVFGRVVDPAADKVLVLGALVFLASPVFLAPELGRTVTGVEAWMVALILAREFLVTSVRAVLETEGVSFGAAWSGKLKMVFQSVGVPLALLLVWAAPGEALGSGGWARWSLDALAWSMTLVTLASGLPYAAALLRHTRSGEERAA